VLTATIQQQPKDPAPYTFTGSPAPVCVDVTPGDHTPILIPECGETLVSQVYYTCCICGFVSLVRNHARIVTGGHDGRDHQASAGLPSVSRVRQTGHLRRPRTCPIWCSSTWRVEASIERKGNRLVGVEPKIVDTREDSQEVFRAMPGVAAVARILDDPSLASQVMTVSSEAPARETGRGSR
jgi:hypothetical protein